MQAEANLRCFIKPLAGLWLFVGFVGLALVVFVLWISNPIEPTVWLIAAVLFAIFVAVPLVVAWLTLRVKSWLALGWVVSGFMVWSFALNWIIRNG